MKPPGISTSGISNFASALTAFAVLISFQSPCGVLADIQDPPVREQGPIRKLGRGVSNMAFGSSEIFNLMDPMNPSFSSSGIFSHGIIYGVGRSLVRFGAGIYEVMTFPLPSYRGGYKPVLPPTTPWVKGGYEEFPPELGFDSRMEYGRNQNWNSRIP